MSDMGHAVVDHFRLSECLEVLESGRELHFGSLHFKLVINLFPCHQIFSCFISYILLLQLLNLLWRDCFNLVEVEHGRAD